MNNRNRIDIAREFTKTPGPRAIDEGEYSGEIFLRDFLRPKYITARNENNKLIINLDGTDGYATSFLESVFGGLAREYSPKEVLDTLEFISLEEPYLIEEIADYIREARD